MFDVYTKLTAHATAAILFVFLFFFSPNMRRVEVRHVQTKSYYRALAVVPRFVGYKLMVYVTALWSCLVDGRLRVDAIFVLMSATYALGATLQMRVPLAITALCEVQTTLSRIKVIT